MLFGITQGRSHAYYPASAYHGPFLSLLRYQPRAGLDFIIAMFNHSAEWYAHPRVPSEYAEPPFEITLTFADGTSRTQWCSGRLWLMYRGMSGGPEVLQCLLMALERWLFEFAEAHPKELDAILQHALKRSESAALTAIVASVATAFPHSSGETLLVLLRSRICMGLDRSRLAHESAGPSRLAGLFPELNGKNEVYRQERKEADALPHRRCDLEMAVANLQLGPLVSRVHAILDEHRAQLPPIAQHHEDDRIWRLAIHRMDLRQYTLGERVPQSRVGTEENATPENPQQYVQLNPKLPEPDVKKMVDESAAKLQAMNARSSLLMWGMKVFQGEEGVAYQPSQWRGRLAEARAADGYSDDKYDPGAGGPGYVAAICVRDHWEDMTDDERDWCVAQACAGSGTRS